MSEEEDAYRPEGMDDEEYARWKEEEERFQKEEEEAERALFEHLLSECQDPVKFRALALMELRKIREAIELAESGIKSAVNDVEFSVSSMDS